MQSAPLSTAQHDGAEPAERGGLPAPYFFADGHGFRRGPDQRFANDESASDGGRITTPKALASTIAVQSHVFRLGRKQKGDRTSSSGVERPVGAGIITNSQRESGNLA